MQSDFLNLRMDKVIDMFLDTYNEIKQIDFTNDRLDIKQYIKYVKTRKEESNAINIMKDEEIEWYSSLENSLPDYSIYGSHNYYKEVIACYLVYSREYIKRLTRTNVNNTSKTIIEYIRDNISNEPIITDLGNGIGYTTLALSELFNTTIYGTNMKDTEQWKFNKILENTYNIRAVEELEEFNTIDVVFASEYFEHIESPFEHLEYLIERFNPKYFIIANSFNKRAVGHFHEYKYKDEIINENVSQKLFMNIIKSYGYNNIDTKLWNNTPIVLERTK